MTPSSNTSSEPPLDSAYWQGRAVKHDDPYLIWTSLVGAYGFGERGSAYQVTVEAPHDFDPETLKHKYDFPSDTLNTVCHMPGSKVLTGTTTLSGLGQLLEDTRLKIKLCVPRLGDLDAGGNDTTDESTCTNGLVIGIIDDGCPFIHENLITTTKGSKTLRVRYLWDQEPTRTWEFWTHSSQSDPSQTKYWRKVHSFGYGRELVTDEIEKKLNEDKPSSEREPTFYRSVGYNLVEADNTHGAHVTHLAAGNRAAANDTKDPASDAQIVFVQLPRDTIRDTSGGSMTMYVLDALKYIVAKAGQAEQIVINLSYGACAGPHDGSSLLERAMDQIVRDARIRPDGKTRKVSLVIPAGNQHMLSTHGEIELSGDTLAAKLFWQVMPDTPTDSFLEIWSTSLDDVRVTVTSPSGTPFSWETSQKTSALNNASSGKTQAMLVYGCGSSNGAGPMLLLAVRPTHEMAAARSEHGIWTIEVAKRDSNNKNEITVSTWVERNDPMPWQDGQLQSHLLSNRRGEVIDNPDTDDDASDPVKRCSAGNSLAHGSEAVVVGGFVGAPSGPSTVASYSSAGPSRNPMRARSWPDCMSLSDESLLNPGVVAAGTRSGLVVRMNGTSVAAPRVARHLINKSVEHLDVRTLSNARGADAPKIT
jgi:hypothetical protein